MCKKNGVMSKDKYMAKCLPVQNKIRVLRESGHIIEAKKLEREELSPIIDQFYLDYYTNPVILINHGCDKAERI
jgi:hypothetical protein